MKLPQFTSLLVCGFVAALSSVACKSEPGPSGGAREPGPALDTFAPVTGETHEAPAPPNSAQTGPKVVFLGDSLSAGLHLPASQAFPAVIERRLRADGEPFQLINAGVSGDTSAGGLRRLDWLLKQEPDVLVLELGANDGLRGQPVEQMADNLRQILERTKARGVKTLLLGMRVPPSHGAEYAEAFAAVYPKLAAQTDTPLVPFLLEGVAGDPALNLPDGIHPTPEGHEVVATNVTDALRGVLRSL